MFMTSYGEALTSDVRRRFAPGEFVLIAAVRRRLWRTLRRWCRVVVVLSRSADRVLMGKMEGRGIGPRRRRWTAHQVLMYLRERQGIRVAQFLKTRVVTLEKVEVDKDVRVSFRYIRNVSSFTWCLIRVNLLIWCKIPRRELNLRILQYFETVENMKEFYFVFSFVFSFCF